MNLETFWPALERCGRQGAAADWQLLAGDDWQSGPLRRTARYATTVLDPRLPARRLEVLDESNGDGPAFAIVDGDYRLRTDVPSTPEALTVWVVDYNKLARLLGQRLGFNPCPAKEHGCCFHVGNAVQKRQATQPVFLHAPTGSIFDHERLLAQIAEMSSCTLLLPNAKLMTKEVGALATARGVQLEPVADRLAMAPAERGTVVVRSRHAAMDRKAILDVRPEWTWERLKVTIHPRGTMTAIYGRQRGIHDFRKASRSKVARQTEMLAHMAAQGEWMNPPSDHPNHEATRKAFRRLEEELKKLIPINGDPFVRSHGAWRAAFQLKLVGVEDVRGEDEREDEE